MADLTVTFAVAKTHTWSAWFQLPKGKGRVDFLAYGQIELDAIKKLLTDDPTFLGITEQGKELEATWTQTS